MALWSKWGPSRLVLGVSVVPRVVKTTQTTQCTPDCEDTTEGTEQGVEGARPWHHPAVAWIQLYVKLNPLDLKVMSAHNFVLILVELSSICHSCKSCEVLSRLWSIWDHPEVRMPSTGWPFRAWGRISHHPADSPIVFPMSRALGFPRLPPSSWAGCFADHFHPGKESFLEVGPSQNTSSQAGQGRRQDLLQLDYPDKALEEVSVFMFPLLCKCGRRTELVRKQIAKGPLPDPSQASCYPCPPTSAHPTPHGLRSEGCEEMQWPGCSGNQRRNRQIPRRRCLLSVSIQRCTAGPGNGGYTGKRASRWEKK